MNRWYWNFLAALLMVSHTTLAEDPKQLDVIRFSRDKDVLFLNAADLAKSLDFELKVVDPRRLVTFCREQDGGYCIPIQLNEDNHRRSGKQLLIAAHVVRAALRFQVIETPERITIAPRAEQPADDPQNVTPAYNAEWGEGRGFHRGDTLPDIPLVDMDGKEVRFSQFLGKRYILYCWASW